jgi:hypothetical protein
MPDYRCPVHDLVFFAVSDNRPPGSVADPVRNLPAHPNVHGHPECPLCNPAFEGDIDSGTQTVI